MARIRTIKPEFFRHDGLFDLEKETGFPIRLAFISLWTVADREGRFKWKPRPLKAECLPYDEVDFSRVLDALATRGFILKYEVDGEYYGYIKSFCKHQVVNNREAQSTLPEPNENNILTRDARVSNASPTPLVQDRAEGKGREREKERISSFDLSNERSQEAEPPPATSAEIFDFEPSPRPSSPELQKAELYRRGKDVLGKNSGGMIAQLLRSRDNSVPLCRAVLEQAAVAENPKEYVARATKRITGPPAVSYRDKNGDCLDWDAMTLEQRRAYQHDRDIGKIG